MNRPFTRMRSWLCALILTPCVLGASGCYYWQPINLRDVQKRSEELFEKAVLLQFGDEKVVVVMRSLDFPSAEVTQHVAFGWGSWFAAVEEIDLRDFDSLHVRVWESVDLRPVGDGILACTFITLHALALISLVAIA